MFLPVCQTLSVFFACKLNNRTLKITLRPPEQVDYILNIYGQKSLDAAGKSEVLVTYILKRIDVLEELRQNEDDAGNFRPVATFLIDCKQASHVHSGFPVAFDAAPELKCTLFKDLPANSTITVVMGCENIVKASLMFKDLLMDENHVFEGTVTTPPTGQPFTIYGQQTENNPVPASPGTPRRQAGQMPPSADRVVRTLIAVEAAVLELLKEIAARQSAVITDSLSWSSLDHPQANHDGVFARIVHLVDHDEDQLCCGMA
ncbi:hypothetical protein DPMN_134771 [Dreissena polymorpha]|uniref:Uncharacterized protein n=1 Tax=Dreissena polymorpha TaxID=45954 RepID=A0A9D4JC72_DREPO|nr:hypothetical protein DPMN_134771 [Dreissena polymorpha]